MESRSTSEPSLIRFSHVQLNYAAISWPEDTHCPNTDTTKGTGTDQALSFCFFWAKKNVDFFFFKSKRSRQQKKKKVSLSIYAQAANLLKAWVAAAAARCPVPPPTCQNRLLGLAAQVLG